MKPFKNELGWHFTGLGIRRKNPSKKSLRNHIIGAILFWVIVAISGYFYTILRDGCPPDIAITVIAVLMIIIIIFGLLSKFWLLTIISLQPRTSSLVINDVIINNPRKDQRLPCYLFKAEIEQESDSDIYRVYLRPSEFLEIEGDSKLRNVLVWETKDAQEASQIVEELCQCGIGETDPEQQCPVIPGNKKTGIAVLVCWVLCLFAVLFLIAPFKQSGMTMNSDSIRPFLHFIRTLLIFVLLSIFVYAAYNIWFGIMAIKHRQIPAPGAIFFCSMRLFQGEKAVKHGRRIVVTAVIIIILSLIGGIYVHYNLESLIGLQNNQEIKTAQK